MKTILVVEDNETDIMLLEDFMEQACADCEITPLRDGSSAQDFFSSAGDGQLPAMILLDLNMPKIDGTDLLPRIRTNGALKDVPVIVWSSAISPHSMAVAEEFGVTDFIVKPHNVLGWKELAEKLRDRLAEAN